MSDREVCVYIPGIMSYGYGSVARGIMRYKDISINAKGLYAYLCSFTGNGRTCFPSRSMMCEELGISNNSFGKYIRELKNIGAVSVSQEKTGDGRFFKNIYTINNDVGPLTKSSVSQNTVYGKTVYGEMNTNSNSSNSNITKEVIKKGMDSDQGTFDLMDCSNAKPHVDAPERPVEASEASEIDNHTPQAKKRATGARSARKQKPFVPPTLEECKAYAVACGRSESDGEEYWKFYDAGDWFRPDGSPVNAWKQQYQTWKNRRKFASKPSMSQQASTFKAAPKGKYDDLPF